MGRPAESDRRDVLSFRNGPFTRDDGGVCFRRRPALVTRNRAGDDAHRPGVLCIEVAVASSLMPSRSGHVGTFHFAFIHAAVVAQRIARLWEFRRLADPTTTSVARGLSRSRRTHVPHQSQFLESLANTVLAGRWAAIQALAPNRRLLRHQND